MALTPEQLELLDSAVTSLGVELPEDASAADKMNGVLSTLSTMINDIVPGDQEVLT